MIFDKVKAFFLCSDGYNGGTEVPEKHKLLLAPVRMKELAETFGMIVFGTVVKRNFCFAPHWEYYPNNYWN